MWPKGRLSISDCAALYRAPIKEDISLFCEAIRNHAGENVTEQQIFAVTPELWAIDLVILTVAFDVCKASSEVARPLVLAIAGEQSALTNTHFLDRIVYYGNAIGGVTADKTPLLVARAFMMVSQIQFQSERTDVNPVALEWAIASVATGSLQGLCELTLLYSKKYGWK